ALEGVLAQAGPACLLFPAAENGVLVETEPAPRDTPSMLLVPDGTWRQARQLIRANPVLHALPRLSLPAGRPRNTGSDERASPPPYRRSRRWFVLWNAWNLRANFVHCCDRFVSWSSNRSRRWALRC